MSVSKSLATLEDIVAEIAFEVVVAVAADQVEGDGCAAYLLGAADHPDAVVARPAVADDVRDLTPARPSP